MTTLEILWIEFTLMVAFGSFVAGAAWADVLLPLIRHAIAGMPRGKEDFMEDWCTVPEYEE